MLIGLDARTICRRDITGVGKYVLRLIQGLSMRNRLVLFSDQPPQTNIPILTAGCSWTIAPAPHRWWWETVTLPTLLRKNRVELYHSTWNYGVPNTRFPRVTTIHDVIPLALPSIYQTNFRQRLSNKIYRHLTAMAIQRSSAVIADSASTAHDVKRFFPEAGEKVRVIHLGNDPVHIDQGAANRVIKRFGISGPFLLYFGGFERRKNVSVLLSAFKRLLPYYPALQLVLVGHRNAYFRSDLSSQIGSNVIITDYLSNNDLYSILSRALALVYPSLYEGFGFPVLEGLNLGVPVITSNVSSIPEIAGDAALLIEPNNEDALWRAIRKVIDGKELRESLSAAGPVQSKKFQWHKTVSATEDVYKEVLTSHQGTG